MITFVPCLVAPSGPPVNITAQATSARSVSITWNPPADEDRNGIILSYIVNITDEETREQMHLTSVSQSLNVTGLMPFTTYLCNVAASTAIGTGPFSTVTIVQTLEAGI